MTAEPDSLFCGIDLGTGGARCVIVDESGRVASRGQCDLQRRSIEGLPEGWFEQDPRDWLNAVRNAISEATEGSSAERIDAAGVTSTSGTLVLVDDAGGTIRNGIMYSDSRSTPQVQEVGRCGNNLTRKLGYRFKPSFGLPKLAWLRDNEPRALKRAHRFLSPTDFIIGWLTGSWNTTDQTNALKFGYDLLEDRWPAFIEDELGIPTSKLPEVRATGSVVGRLRGDIAAEVGLPAGTPVTAGMTDGCASQASSGAVEPGDVNTTIGTTLVMKAVSEQLLLDPRGRIYCHRHPEGWWLPGGASNTGARCLEEEFGGSETERRSRNALAASPTDAVAYPLTGTGERFPFAAPDAAGFMLGQTASRDELFAAYLEGVACVERMCVQMLEELGAEPGETVYSAGGGAASNAWLQIRADTLNRRVARPAEPGAAMGAAIAAASWRRYSGLSEAGRNMVRMEQVVEPRNEMTARYEDKFRTFHEECIRRGYTGS